MPPRIKSPSKGRKETPPAEKPAGPDKRPRGYMRAKIKPPPDKIAANKRNRRKLLPTAILRLMIRRRGARKRRPKVLQPKKNANIKAHGLTEYSGENPPGRLHQPCRQGSKSPLPVRALSLWPVGQAVKTPPFHGGNMGLNPVRVTTGYR